MRKTTQRQYHDWMLWLNKDLERPSRSDQYLIQLTAELRLFRQQFSKKRLKISFKEFLLRFSEEKPPVNEESKKAATLASKRRWFAGLGLVDELRKLEEEAASPSLQEPLRNPDG